MERAIVLVTTPGGIAMLDAEIARDDRARAIGLAGRASLDEGLAWLAGIKPQVAAVQSV